MKALQHIFEFPFVKELQDKGAEIFIVGGSVRDAILGKEPKDIDIIVRLLPFNDIIASLEKHGKVDLVGESFGVIKFTFKGEIYDIAIPRVDSPGKPLIVVKQNNKNESSDVFKIKYGGTSNEKISKS